MRCMYVPIASERLWARIQERLPVVPAMERPSPEGWVVVRLRLSRLGRV